MRALSARAAGLCVPARWGLAMAAPGVTGASAKDKIKAGLILPGYDQLRWQSDRACGAL